MNEKLSDFANLLLMHQLKSTFSGWNTVYFEKFWCKNKKH